jgi:hypothetical protein
MFSLLGAAAAGTEMHAAATTPTKAFLFTHNS